MPTIHAFPWPPHGGLSLQVACSSAFAMSQPSEDTGTGLPSPVVRPYQLCEPHYLQSPSIVDVHLEGLL